MSGIWKECIPEPWTDDRENPLPSDNWSRTYGMGRTSESEDLAETECDRNERLL